MSYCRVVVRKHGRAAFVRKAGDLALPLLKVNGAGTVESLPESILGASVGTVPQRIESNDGFDVLLIDVTNEDYTIPTHKGNLPSWIDMKMVIDQAIGLTPKVFPICPEDMDLIRRNFTILNA